MSNLTDPAIPAAKNPGNRREHRGDIMSAEKRSAVMARIRSRDTKPELAVAAILDSMGVQYERHARDLPGRPDFILRQSRVALLVDGDFWHGWRFAHWRTKLSDKWERKIAGNIRRDARNRQSLRQQGWTVVRLWEHQVTSSPSRCRRRIRTALERCLLTPAEPGNVVGPSRDS